MNLPSAIATAIGSMPQADPAEACAIITRYLSSIPVWPQLPRRSFLENMYAQYSEGFPGVVIQGERIYVDTSRDLAQPLEKLYQAYLENDFEHYGITPGYAAGLHAFLSSKVKPEVAVKGQVTGPISWGLAVTDQDRRPLAYDEVLSDAIARHLRLKAAWLEATLKSVCPHTVIFIDEPYLASLGSAFVSLPPQKVRALLEEVLGGIKGLKGIHCCGNTDWALLLETGIDILNFDAYNYARSLSLYPEQVDTFLKRGGAIAWGIVPSDEELLSGENVDSLVKRLDAAMGLLADKGVSRDALREQCLITPSCGLGSLSEATSVRALELTAGVSAKLRGASVGSPRLP
ncbi:MAG: methionine synthase [Dehalococcoidia bacterium]|nr:methionine synthase [Dehalococcoidia bacterium]